MMDFENKLRVSIDPENHAEFGPCSCCGNMTVRVWGYIEEPDPTIAAYRTLAAYFVEWTPGHDENSASFDLIVGHWGEDADATKRQGVALDFRRLKTGAAFRVIDATSRPFARDTEIARTMLTREEVLQSDIRFRVFAICDVIFLQDPRIGCLRG